MQLAAGPIGHREDGPYFPAAEILVKILSGRGVRVAFGVTGGPIASFVLATERSPEIRWVMTRTEGAAVYAAIGAWAVTCEPGLIVTTCGPGLFATRQALEVAKRDGFRGVLVSPRTPASVRGSHAAQGSETFVSADYSLPGILFDLMVELESVQELVPLAARLAAGLSGPDGFLAHVVVPSDLLVTPAQMPAVAGRRPGRLVPDRGVVEQVLALLSEHRFAILAGRGARAHAELIRSSAELTGAPVVTTPGAKGIVDERSFASFGVSGIGGRPETMARLQAYRPDLLLALGTGMSDASVSAEMIALAPLGLIHVDRDAAAMGAAWDVPTLAVQSDVGAFLEALLAERHRLPMRPPVPVAITVPDGPAGATPPAGYVSPRTLMASVQKAVVDGSDAPIFVEVGTAWPWVASCLSFSEPGRLFLEIAVGSMATANGGALGAAIGRPGKAVALTGDWALEMLLGEIHTAVDQNTPVVWIVLNNAAGQMVLDGDRTVWGQESTSARFRPVDFAAIARAFGARAARVTSSRSLSRYIGEAMSSTTPYLLDVATDMEMPPYEDRFRALQRARDAARSSQPGSDGGYG